MRVLQKFIALFLSLILALTLLPETGVSAETSFAELTFSDEGITETAAGSGYAINGTSLIISSAGVYRLSGTCSEGTVEVTKGVSDVILILEDLNLTSAVTAPLVIKKTASVTVHLNGENTLTNNEDPANETSEDPEIAEAFEGAALKAKSGASVTFCGGGTLNVFGNAKNGIKGGAETSMVFQSGSYHVNAVNNGIASDGSLVFNGGNYTIDSENDGIKSVPDVDDTDSVGSVIINGGTYTINALGDGIQADTELTVNNGTISIQTMGGYSDSSFDKDTMSCKGLKASGDRENIEHKLNVNGGVFELNTADDSIHSDGDAVINGGTFHIQSGDDAVHADGTLTLGTENGYDRDPNIYVSNSYEGLEGANVYVYSGRYYVTASDDGVNAACGSDSSGGWDPWHGGPGQGGSSDYNIYFYGGNTYVNCTGDGLDSNGGLYLYGGMQTVLSQGQGGDNSPLDSDGTMILNGSTVFTAGTNPMNDNPSNGYQKYFTWRTNYQAGTVISLTDSSKTLYSEKLLRRINYMLYSDPSVTAQPSVSTASAIDSCHSNDWAHQWDEGKIEKEPTETEYGLRVFTCTNCGKTEYQTIPYSHVYTCDGHEDTQFEEDPGYAVTFVTDENTAIDIYYTQDLTAPDKTDVTSAVSRNSDTGAPDSTGSGQVNFAIRIAEGYTVDSINIEGSYKNLKDISTETNPNTYRVTKVASELVITVTVKEAADPVAVYGHSLSLDGTIGVNFYMTVPDELLDQTYFNLNINGENKVISAAEAPVRTAGGQERRVITASVYAKQMHDDIILTVTDAQGNPMVLVDGNGNDVSDGYTYSVAAYIEKAKTTSTDEKLHLLADAMGTYGSYAQIYFEYNTDHTGTPGDVSAVTDSDVSTYQSSVRGKAEGIEYSGTAMELNSASSIRSYFTMLDTRDPQSYTCTVDGKETELIKRSGYENMYYLVSEDIAAKDLAQLHIFTVSDGTDTLTVEAGPLSYVYNALSSDSGEALKNVCRALYLYHLRAVEYFS